MKLTLKIAIGEFLGVMASYIVLQGVRSIREAEARKELERAQQRESEQRANEILAEGKLPSLTPEKLIRLCGKPLGDTTRTSGAARAEFRTITYPGIAVEFLRSEGHWVFAEVEDVNYHLRMNPGVAAERLPCALAQ